MAYYTLSRVYPRDRLREGYFREPVYRFLFSAPKYVKPDAYCVEAEGIVTSSAVSSVITATVTTAVISASTFALGVCCET